MSETRVLLVDDKSNWRDTVTKLLQKENCHLASASNCDQARDLLSQDHFDVVITNMRLEETSPVLQGFEVLDQVRTLGGGTQCIVLSEIDAFRAAAWIHNKYRDIVVAIISKSNPWVDYDDFLYWFREAQAKAKQIAGGYTMQQSRNLIDWLVDTLDFLRHNAQNVLIERWEKRNQGKAVTPPAFGAESHTREELRTSLPPETELRAKLNRYQKLDGTAVIVTEQHIKSLREQMTTAQESVDRYNLELSRPLSAAERIPIEYQKDEFQKQINQAVEELADVLAFLYSK